MTMVELIRNAKANLQKKKDYDAVFFYNTYIDSIRLLKKMRAMSSLPDGFHVRNMGDNKEYWRQIYEMIVLISLEYANENSSEANKDIYETVDRISMAFWEELINSFSIELDPFKAVETFELLIKMGLVEKENWKYVLTKKGVENIKDMKNLSK